MAAFDEILRNIQAEAGKLVSYIKKGNFKMGYLYKAVLGMIMK